MSSAPSPHFLPVLHSGGGRGALHLMGALEANAGCHLKGRPRKAKGHLSDER